MQAYSDLLAARIREIRLEMVGGEDATNVAQIMNLSPATWEHFENGVMMPAWVVLQFIELTGVEPHWLLTGEGQRYRISSAKSSLSASR